MLLGSLGADKDDSGQKIGGIDDDDSNDDGVDDSNNDQ